MSTAAYVSLSFLVLVSSCECCGRRLAVPRMVAISPCMKAQGTEEPARGHRSPLGQYTWGKKMVMRTLLVHYHIYYNTTFSLSLSLKT